MTKLDRLLYPVARSVATSEIKALMREELMLYRHIEMLGWLLQHEPSTLTPRLLDALEPGWLQGVIEGLSWVRGTTRLVDGSRICGWISYCGARGCGGTAANWC